VYLASFIIQIESKNLKFLRFQSYTVVITSTLLSVLFMMYCDLFPFYRKGTKCWLLLCDDRIFTSISM